MISDYSLSQLLAALRDLVVRRRTSLVRQRDALAALEQLQAERDDLRQRALAASQLDEIAREYYAVAEAAAQAGIEVARHGMDEHWTWTARGAQGTAATHGEALAEALTYVLKVEQ